MHRIREALELIEAGLPAGEMLCRMNLHPSQLRRILNGKRFAEELRRLVASRLRGGPATGQADSPCPPRPEERRVSPDVESICNSGPQRDTAGHPWTAPVAAAHPPERINKGENDSCEFRARRQPPEHTPVRGRPCPRLSATAAPNAPTDKETTLVRAALAMSVRRGPRRL